MVSGTSEYSSQRPSQPSRAGGEITAAGRLPWTVAIFLIGLATPLFVYVGPLRLTVYRLILLLLFFPGLYLLVSGKAGRLRLPDFCVIMICIWSSISLIVVHGLSSMIQPIGILWVETLGAYMLGRCFIRTPEAFYASIRLLFWLAVILLPFALYENFTDENLPLRFFHMIGNTYTDGPRPKRLGMFRAQGPFVHEIHLGVFFGSLIGVAYYVLGYGRGRGGRIWRSGVVGVLGASALSSGPLAAIMAQIYFLLWDGVLKTVKARWYILSGLAAFGYVFIDVLSNRTPFAVFISYFALNKATAYNRLRIWEYGTQNIFNNPLFGIGFNDWQRPYWMSDSVDMFWILGGMRHGLLVWILYMLMFLSIFFAVAYTRNLDERARWCRMGYLTTMFGLFVAGWTVHYWDALFAFFMFILASGVWLLDYSPPQEAEAEEPPAEQPPSSSYTRFPPSSPARQTMGRGERLSRTKGDDDVRSNWRRPGR